MIKSKTSINLKEEERITNQKGNEEKKIKSIKSIPKNLKDMKETDYSKWLIVNSKYKKLLKKEKKL